MIEDYFDKTATVKRLTGNFGGDPDKYDYQTVATVSCALQQVSAEFAALVGGVFGRTWRMFCARGSDIKHTDRVTIDGIDYTIKGIDDQATGVFTPHLSVVLVEDAS